MNYVGLSTCHMSFICAESLNLIIIEENDSRTWMLYTCKGASLLPHRCISLQGMNKEISPKELINGHPFQSDSYATPACVTIMDLLTLRQCYSKRYQNIIM